MPCGKGISPTRESKLAEDGGWKYRVLYTAYASHASLFSKKKNTAFREAQTWLRLAISSRRCSAEALSVTNTRHFPQATWPARAFEGVWKIADTRHSLRASRHLSCGKALDAVAITRHSARTSRKGRLRRLDFAVAITRHSPQASRHELVVLQKGVIAITRHSAQASRLFSFFRAQAVYYVAITRHFPRGSLSADPAIVAHRKRGRCVASAPTREHAKYPCHLESRTRDIHRGRQGVPSKTADYAQVAITRHLLRASRGYGTLTARSPIANTRHSPRASRHFVTLRLEGIQSRLRDICCGHQGSLQSLDPISFGRDYATFIAGIKVTAPYSRRRPCRDHATFCAGVKAKPAKPAVKKRRDHATFCAGVKDARPFSRSDMGIYRIRPAKNRFAQTSRRRFAAVFPAGVRPRARYRITSETRPMRRSPTPSGRANVAHTRHSLRASRHHARRRTNPPPIATTRHLLRASRHLPFGKAFDAVANTRHSPRVARELAQGPKRPLVAITRHSSRAARRAQVALPENRDRDHATFCAGIKGCGACPAALAYRDHATFCAGIKGEASLGQVRVNRDHATFCAGIKGAGRGHNPPPDRDHATFCAGIKGKQCVIQLTPNRDHATFCAGIKDARPFSRSDMGIYRNEPTKKPLRAGLSATSDGRFSRGSPSAGPDIVSHRSPRGDGRPGGIASGGAFPPTIPPSPSACAIRRRGTDVPAP